jgi:hypothetical protein
MVHKYSIPLSTEGIVLYTMYDEPLYTISLVSSLGGDNIYGGGKIIRYMSERKRRPEWSLPL